ncbi:MAG TPA: hypothetical protein VFL47_05155, partial [Flavisolibacter sp.]|nr:hypothetical protein [Flavisolibacter sp.]
MSRRSVIESFRPTRLRTQLILGIAFVHLLLMSVFVVDVETRQKQFLKEQNHQQTLRFVSDYAVNSTRHLIANDFDELERLTLSYRNFPNLKYAMILSPQGLVIAHTNTNYVGKVPTDPISRRLFGSTGTTTLVEDDHVLDVATPVLADKKLI